MPHFSINPVRHVFLHVNVVSTSSSRAAAGGPVKTAVDAFRIRFRFKVGRRSSTPGGARAIGKAPRLSAGGTRAPSSRGSNEKAPRLSAGGTWVPTSRGSNEKAATCSRPRAALRKAPRVAGKTESRLGRPPRLRRSAAFDNGKEFAEHERLTRRLKLDVYFANPYYPWQQGTNVHTNGLLGAVASQRDWYTPYLIAGAQTLQPTDQRPAAKTFQLPNARRSIRAACCDRGVKVPHARFACTINAS